MYCAERQVDKIKDDGAYHVPQQWQHPSCTAAPLMYRLNPHVPQHPSCTASTLMHRPSY